MTAPHPRSRTTPFICVECGGPVRAYAGSVHGWKCRPCLAAYIEQQADPPEKTRTRRDTQITDKDTAA